MSITGPPDPADTAPVDEAIKITWDWSSPIIILSVDTGYGQAYLDADLADRVGDALKRAAAAKRAAGSHESGSAVVFLDERGAKYRCAHQASNFTPCRECGQ